MKNGNNYIFNVKKSFAIDNQVIVMEDDQLKYLSTNNDDESVDIYFEVVNSFWCEGIEINLTPQQVVEHLTYAIIIR
jgi:hypothetical protein